MTNKSGVGDTWFSAYDWANASINPWSWRAARNKFYEGLTLKIKAEREKALADAFRAIGHVIHLVEDVAVPAHTKGDLHISEPYEKYTDKNIGSLSYASVPFQYWNISISPSAPKQFWDLESYNGSIPYGSGYIGLAEYTNANFASSDTIFSETLLGLDSHYFPFPMKSSSILYEGTNSQGKKTKYFKIIKESENIEHFAVAGRFYDIFEGWPNLQRSFISLDDKCHDDYQKKLIPRAVGYSAGLLDYFFGGEIDMVPDKETGSGYVIENNSEEDMNGTFELWYDDENDARKIAWKSPDNFSIGKKGKSTNITFTSPTDAKEPCKYILVFRGQMGQEQGAVVGKIVKAIECVTGRIVSIAGSRIIVRLKGLVLETNIPEATWQQTAKAIRFDVNNPDRFGVLIMNRNTNWKDRVYLFKIDVARKTIEKERTEELNITTNRSEHYLTGFQHLCCNSSGGFGWYEEIYHNETRIVTDFYLKSGIVKPLGSFFKSIDHYFVHSDSISYLLDYTDSHGIFFGDTIVVENTQSDSGGSFDIISAVGNGYNGSRCEYSTDMHNACWVNYTANGIQGSSPRFHYGPITILNESDVVYSVWDTVEASSGWYIGRYIWTGNATTVSGVDMYQQNPTNWSYDYYYYGDPQKVFQIYPSMLRKDGKYSFTANGFSYSSEIGKVNCGGYLIGENKIGWSRNTGNIVKFNSCTNVKPLHYLGLPDSNIWDIILEK